MKKTSRRYTKVSYAVVLALAISHAQVGRAGWSGAMNGTGSGTASVNVHAFDTAGGKTKYATTQVVTEPSAAIPPAGYKANNNLPDDASPATVAKVAGFAGYIWQANVVGSDGDDTGDAELEARVTITAADCASLTMQTSSEIDTTKKTGTITVNVTGTAGTAIWLRGYELKDPSFQSPPPDDELTPDVNEFVEYLKAHGTLKWDVLNVGPLDQNTANCNALKIPFSYETSINNLYAVSDGVAKSLPLVIQCPNDITVNCEQSVSYPETVIVGGCGNITVSFNPPPIPNDPPAVGNKPFPPGFFHVGSNPVTVTATDKDGNTTNCTFNVVVTDTTPPVITATGTPANGALSGFNPTPEQIEAALGTATANDNCGVGTPTATTGSVSVNGCSRSQTRTWNVSDAGNNAATPVARTATWTVDTTPPVITATGTPANGVLGSNPTALQIETALGTATATDNCGGTVTPTPTTGSVIVNGCVSSQTRTWNVSDAAGNPATPVSRTVTWGAGISFTGFYSPIGTVSNTCTPPSVVQVNRGSVAPIKFDFFCGTSRIVTGTPPTVDIQPVLSDCSLTGTATTVLAEYQNDWHYNWDTSGWLKGTYKVSVNLPGGMKPYVFIKIK